MHLSDLGYLDEWQWLRCLDLKECIRSKLNLQGCSQKSLNFCEEPDLLLPPPSPWLMTSWGRPDNPTRSIRDNVVVLNPAQLQISKAAPCTCKAVGMGQSWTTHGIVACLTLFCPSGVHWHPKSQKLHPMLSAAFSRHEYYIVVRRNASDKQLATYSTWWDLFGGRLTLLRRCFSGCIETFSGRKIGERLIATFLSGDSWRGGHNNGDDSGRKFHFD